MARPDPDVLARDIRQVLAIVGLPEAQEGTRAGGYGLAVHGGRVRVTWWTDDPFSDGAMSIALNHREHPVARLERGLVAAMERALADVLYAAGFTLSLQPGVRASDPQKDSDPAVFVVSGPDFKAWADS